MERIGSAGLAIQDFVLTTSNLADILMENLSIDRASALEEFREDMTAALDKLAARTK